MCSEERIKENLRNEFLSEERLKAIYERNRKIKPLKCELKMSPLMERYFRESCFCYMQGYFVASIALTAMFIESILKEKLFRRTNKDIQGFKCINELCKAYDILSETNYSNAETIRTVRNNYIHFDKERIAIESVKRGRVPTIRKSIKSLKKDEQEIDRISYLSDEKDAIDMINKARGILEELFE